MYSPTNENIQKHKNICPIHYTIVDIILLGKLI